MINLKDLIFGTNLDEGLIKTYPSKDVVVILNRDWNFKNRFSSLAVNDNIIKVYFSNKNIYRKDPLEDHIRTNYFGVDIGDEVLSFLLSKLNLMGYIPLKFQMYSSGKLSIDDRFNYNKAKKIINDSTQSDTFDLYFSAKYSEIVKDKIPEKIYHLSESKEKILKIGLSPRGNETYDSRIYFSFKIENSDSKFVKNLKNFKTNGNKECVFLNQFEIDTRGLNLILYKDPEYKNLGYYCKKNIPPTHITFLNQI